MGLTIDSTTPGSQRTSNACGMVYKNTFHLPGRSLPTFLSCPAIIALRRHNRARPMSMTDAQLTTFFAVVGFTPQLSSVLWRSSVLVLALLWCAWALWTGYRGWAAGNISFGALGGSTLRIVLTLIVLMFFTLS
ncbi:hypothetical protein D3C77_373770 [compost metagenome]